ncbi:MAG: hypothetical protein CSA95_01915 [Bacteroidetes bacterium]|nr:MAG: hypothetical protein CSA95_01915 [Bacteroidota bacterium]
MSESWYKKNNKFAPSRKHQRKILWKMDLGCAPVCKKVITCEGSGKTNQSVLLKTYLWIPETILKHGVFVT